jgi:hypothetical protein
LAVLKVISALKLSSFDLSAESKFKGDSKALTALLKACDSTLRTLDVP